MNILSEHAFNEAQKAFDDAGKAHDTGIYEDWAKLHDGLVSVAERFGEVIDIGDDGDFYHSGDWFSSNHDALVILNSKILKKIRLEFFQQELATHPVFSSITIAGEVSSEVDGLEFLIHRDACLATWRKKSPEECQKKLLSLGLRLS